MIRRIFHVLLILAAGAICALMPLAPAQAGPLSSGIEHLGSAVSDEDLSEMRGRFATPNGISYFGLEMQTQWYTPDGTATQAKLLISLDLGGAGRVTPQVYVSWQRDESNSALEVPGGSKGPALNSSGTNSGLIPLGGLATVHGAVQSQQIAGADNTVRNAMTISIVPDASAAASTAGLTPISGNMTRTFADGDTVQFLLNGSQVGIVMTGQGGDAVRQTVNSGANQLAQHVLINSDANDIFSRMNLTIGMDPATQSGRIGATNALNAMGGNGF